MSHTTTIKQVAIKDINALKAAVARLQSEGAKISLHENVVPRMYYRAQEEQIGKCDFVIKTDNGRYDIGLKKVEGTAEEYEAVFDAWGGDIKSQVGANPNYKCENQEEQHQANIGKLMQYYGIEAAKATITAQGGIVEQETVDEYGNVQLVVASL